MGDSTSVKYSISTGLKIEVRGTHQQLPLDTNILLGFSKVISLDSEGLHQHQAPSGVDLLVL